MLCSQLNNKIMGSGVWVGCELKKSECTSDKERSKIWGDFTSLYFPMTSDILFKGLMNRYYFYSQEYNNGISIL